MAGRKLSPFKKFIIILGSLCILEAGYILYFSQNVTTKTTEEIVREALQKAPGGGVERQVQMAIQMYRTENNGKLPETLTQLVPKYLSSQPIDPATQKPLAYRIEGDMFFVGSGSQATTLAKEGAAGEPETPDRMSVQAFLQALSEPPNAKLAHYDPSNKRDPFRPCDLSNRTSFDVARTPLQGVEVTELSLTAVIEQGDEARALVETPDGVGHSIKKGDKIGLRGGEVVEITPEAVDVLESETDFTGETKTKTVQILRKGSRAKDLKDAGDKRKKESRS